MSVWVSSSKSVPGAWRATPREGFLGQEWNWCISLLLPFHRADLSYAATPVCGEGRGEEMSIDFVEDLAVPAQNVKAFSAGAGIQ